MYRVLRKWVWYFFFCLHWSILGEGLVLFIDSFKVCLDMHKMKNLNPSLRNMRFELTVQMISDFC